MLSSFKTFLFRRLLINLLIFSIKIMGLILNTLYSIIAPIAILLRFTILVLGKNLAIKILVFIVLLSIKGFLIDFLKSSK